MIKRIMMVQTAHADCRDAQPRNSSGLHFILWR